MTDPPFIGVVGVCASLRHRVPFALICHDVFPDIAVAMGRLRSKTVLSAWRQVNRVIRGRASRILVVGRDMAERLASQGVDPSKLIYVPTWADPQTIDPDRARALRERYGWSGRFVVMHAGNAGLAQNLGILAELADRVRDSPEIQVVVLGDGPGKPRLEEIVAERRIENLQLLPMLPKESAQALMAAADLHIITLVPGLWGCATPSKTYGIMAAGRPFVAAVDQGSEPARLAAELDCGRWVPAGDAEALARAVRELRSAPLDAMGQRARVAFEQRFTRSLITSETAKVLEEIAHARIPSRAHNG
jgi:glycosyltransferase involved in cell wall biosynthesis